LGKFCENLTSSNHFARSFCQVMIGIGGSQEVPAIGVVGELVGLL
jgi:hypothetical protein